MDYYAILGVSPGASIEAIEQAYRERIRLIHPDLNQDPRDAHRRTKSSAELNAIIKILRDPARRAAYDQDLLLEARRGAERGVSGAAAAPRRPEPTRPSRARGQAAGSGHQDAGRRDGDYRRDSEADGTRPLGRQDGAQWNAPRSEPRSQARPRPSLPLTVPGLIALGLLLVLVGTIALGQVPPIVGLLLVPALLPPFRSASADSGWRVESTGWLLLFEACLPGLAGVALIVASPNNPQYLAFAGLSMGLALLLIAGAASVRWRGRRGAVVAALAAVAALAWAGILLYVLPALAGNTGGGPQVGAWLVVPVVILMLLASLVRSPAALVSARS